MRFPIGALALLLAACGQTAPDAASTGDAQVPASTAASPSTQGKVAEGGIDWFEGSVEEALSRAKSEARPIFLYWGAQWCPPCNQIKSTIFVREDFIARTRQFIAVYLDGDSDGAQRWGEHFGTSGYPTLIVLQPDGTELTRLSSGMDGARYPEVLDLALARNRPLRELLATALSTPKALAAEDWSLLALYSWEADNGRSLPAREQPETLRRLADACPETLTLPRQRLQLLAAIASLDAGQSLPPATIELLRDIAGSPASARLNLTELQYYAADLIEKSSIDDGSVRDALTSQLRALMDQIFSDASLPIKQRLLSTRLLIDLAALEGRGESSQLQDLVRARARWADQQATTPYLRQSLIYNAAWYLHDVGLSQEALAMFEAELPRAVSPHYYMSYLSAIEEDLGHARQALDWARQAWEGATGPATRTQWGTSYALAMIRLDPDNTTAVKDAVTRLLDEMRAGGDGFYQRSLKRMQRLNTALKDWSASGDDARQSAAAALLGRLRSMCRDDLGEDGECGEFA